MLGAIVGLVAASAAAPKQADDEVIVYGDQFARWDHTRWLLQSELWLPLGMDFASDDNFTFRSFGFQIRAVVLCDKDARLAKHRWEVSCAVEELGLLATTENRWRTERDREIAAAVLEAVDQRLTGRGCRCRSTTKAASRTSTSKGWTRPTSASGGSRRPRAR